MRQRQAVTMQRQTPEAERAKVAIVIAFAVVDVADERMAGVFAVAAHLVEATGLWARFSSV